MDVVLEFLFDGDTYPEDSENAIQKTQLWHFQRSSRGADRASGAMHGGQVSSVAEVVDPVVATRSHREQGSGVSVVCACGSVHCSSVPSGEASVPFSFRSGILKGRVWSWAPGSGDPHRFDGLIERRSHFTSLTTCSADVREVRHLLFVFCQVRPERSTQAL